MLCPSCKNEVPDNSKFCLNCGNPIMNESAKPVIYDYEYKDFSYEIGVTYSEVGRLRTREIPEDLWREYQDEILPEIRKWVDKGWEPISEIGPAGFKVFEEGRGCFAFLLDPGGYNNIVKVNVPRLTVKMRKRKTSESA